MLDALARDHPHRLQHEQLVVGETQVGADASGHLVGRRRRVLEVHDVGDDPRRPTQPPCDLLPLRRVDAGMTHVRQRRWEGCADDVGDAVDHEALPLPGQVVVVRQHRDAGLGCELRDGQAQGQVHGDGQRVLRQQHVQLEVTHERVEGRLQVSGELIDLPADRLRAA